jgi:L-threonylcarbamoyladenylate synthase
MPPPVLIGDVRTMDGLADGVSDEVRELVTKFWPGPLTIILNAQPSLQWDLGETRGTVALRMPDHELTLAVLRRTGPLAVSSANTSGSPPATTAAEAASMLGGSVRVYLDGGASPGGVASTIVDATGPRLRIVREGGLSAEDLGISVAEPAEATGEKTAEQPAKPVRKPRTRKPKPAADAEAVVPEDERSVAAAAADTAVAEEVAPAPPKPRRPRKPAAPVAQEPVVEEAVVEEAVVEAPAEDVVVPEAVVPQGEPVQPDEPVEPAPAAAAPAAPKPRRPRKPTAPVAQDTAPDAPAEPPAEAPQP